MTTYQTPKPKPTGQTIRIRRSPGGGWQRVALLKLGAGWVCVEADGPLWVRAVPEQIHAEDLRRLRWVGLPVGE
jgi:hypothetical protein